jgi:hypothetical protein
MTFTATEKRRLMRQGASQPWRALAPAPRPEPETPAPTRCLLCGIALVAVDTEDLGNDSPDGFCCSDCHERYPQRAARLVAQHQGKG